MIIKKKKNKLIIRIRISWSQLRGMGPKIINYKIRKLDEIDRHEEFVVADFYLWNLNSKSSFRILIFIIFGWVSRKMSIFWRNLPNVLGNISHWDYNAIYTRLRCKEKIKFNYLTSPLWTTPCSCNVSIVIKPKK